MNAKPWLCTCLLCLSVLYGCAVWPSAPGASPPYPTAETYRQKALALENAGELQQALFAWRAAARLDPDNSEFSAGIRTLERGIDNAADAHFKKGYYSLQSGDMTTARREFLITLRLSPGHSKALYYLKTRMNRPDHEVYKVERGDSFSKIAAEKYKDAGKGSLVASFNGLDPNKPLYIDTLLLLPVLDGPLAQSRTIGTLVERARGALEKKLYEEVLVLSQTIADLNPANPQVQALNDAARFGLGTALTAQKKWLLALEQLKQVSPSYAGRERALRQVQDHLRRQAVDEKMRLAREQFDQGAHTSAIAVCDEILSREPSHGKAHALRQASYYALGRKLLDQGQEAMAIDAFQTLDPAYQDVHQLMVQAHARLNARADALYRKGVKHFLNEELELAIESWEKALALNPDHPKAKQDVDNALKLLDKWRDLEKGDKKGH